MALDRKIRIGISTSELLAAKDYDGEDVEVRLALGKTELERNFDLLMRARDRPNGILGEGEELSAPDTLVKSAESALKNGLPKIAERAVLSFLLQTPPKNQFFCRALFIQAQLQSQKTLNKQSSGDDLVLGTLKAVDFIRKALDVAMDANNRPRYDFLVYNASVHYWNVIRPLLRAGVQRYLVESFSHVVKCLETVEESDFTWRCQLLLSLARCCDDASNGVDALKHASSALDLLIKKKEEEDSTNVVPPQLWSEVCRCVVHMARIGAGDASKQLDRVKSSSIGDSRGLAEFNLQCIKSNITKGPADISLSLTATLEHLTGTDEDGNPQNIFISDLLVEGGLLAAANGLDDISNTYLKEFDGQRGAGGIHTIRADFLRCQLMARSLPEESLNGSGKKRRETRGTKRNKKIKEEGFNPLKIDKRRLNALRVSRQVEAIKILERALNAAKRSDDVDVLHEGCVLTWNLGLPLLQPHLRRHIHRAFNIAAGALEEVDSQSFKSLRAKFHFEIAKTEVASDFLQKAATHVNKALALDYGNVSNALTSDPVFAATSGGKASKGGGKEEKSEGSDDPDTLRPLDRFLIPLQKKLALKSSIYKEPDTVFDTATIMVEQAKDANDAHLKGTLLKRVTAMLQAEAQIVAEAKLQEEQQRQQARSAVISQAEAEGVEAPPDDTNIHETEEEQSKRLRSESQLTALWSDILKMTWELKLLPLVSQAARAVLEKVWSPEEFKEIVLLQIDAHFTRGQASVENVRRAPARWWNSATGVDGLHPKALGLLGGSDGQLSDKIISLKKQVISSFVNGCELALKLKETSLVENAAVYLWNFHMHIFRDTKGVQPSSARFTRMIPELTPAFETMLSGLQEVGSQDVPLICNICEALALIHEHSGNNGGVNDVCKVGVDAAQGKPLYSRPLVNIATRVSGNKSSPVSGGNPVLQVMGIVQALTIHADAGQLTQGMAMLEECRDILLYDVTSPDIVSAAKDAAVAVSRGANDTKKEGGVNGGNVLEKTLEDVHAGQEIWSELCTKLGQCALSLGDMKKAQICGSWCASAIPSNENDLKLIPKVVWRWHALMECVWGRSIFRLIDPTRQERALQDDLRDTAMVHLCTSAQWAVRAQIPSMVLVAAKQVWNVGVRSMGSKLTRKALREPVSKVLSFLAACGESSDLQFRVNLYQLLLKCYEDAEEWQVGLSAVQEAFQYVPKVLQRPLWSSRVKFLSKLGKNVAEGINKMKESDVSMQARAWLTLADSSTDEQDTLSAYLSSIDITTGTFHQVECLLSLSTFLYRSGYPRKDVVLYTMKAMDFLLQFDDAAMMANGGPSGELEEGGDLNGGGTAGGGGSIAGSRVSKGSRSTRGGGSRMHGGGSVGTSSRSIISATTASVRSESRDSEVPMLNIRHFAQLLEGALLLSTCSTRADEREDALLLGHQYVLRIWSKSYDLIEHDITTKLFAELPEFDEAGNPQPSYEDWSSQYWVENSKPHQAPLSDHDWLTFWPDDAVLESFNNIALTMLDINSWSSVETTILHLEQLANMLMDHGYLLHALPVLVLWDVLTRKVLRPTIPSMSKFAQYLHIRCLRELNLHEIANRQASLLFDAANSANVSLLPTSKELEQYEEEVVQREQMNLGSETKSNMATPSTQIFAQSFERLQVHTVWLKMARICIMEGKVGVARSLLVEAERHALAFEDSHASANIFELNTNIALLEGDSDTAGKMLDASMGTKDAVVNVSVATKRILLRAAILISTSEGHMAKKLLNHHSNALTNLSKLSLSKSLDRGGKERGGFVSDLDVSLAQIDVNVTLANMLSDEVISLKNRDSPWEEEWKKCERLYQTSVEMLESLGDRGKRLPNALERWSESILRVERNSGIKFLPLLERAEFHCLLRCSLVVTSARNNKKSLLVLSFPIQRMAAALQLKIGRYHLERGKLAHMKKDIMERTMRGQERRMGTGGGDDDNVVSQWLERTAAPPPLNSDDCEVLPTAYALTKFSSANSLSTYVPSFHTRTQVHVGLALLALSYEKNQCVGVWPRLTSPDRDEESVYADSLRRVNGDGLLIQARFLLESSLKEASKMSQWEVVALAAKGIADSYGNYNPAEAAKYISLWQSCVARKYMLSTYQAASRSCAPENYFVRRVMLDEQDLSAGEKHYLDQNSVAWKRMNCSESVENILKMCPVDMPILTIQGDRQFNTIYVSAQRNTGDIDENGKVIVQAAVYRHYLDESSVSELKNLLFEFSSWKKYLPGALVKMNSNPSSDREPPKNAPVDPNRVDPTEVEFALLVNKMSTMLNPFLAIPDIMKVLRTGEPKHCVMCIDMRLQELPIELIPSISKWNVVTNLKKWQHSATLDGGNSSIILDESKIKSKIQPSTESVGSTTNSTEDVDVKAPALSRDFSLHVFRDRLISSGATLDSPSIAPSTTLSNSQFIVDSRNEDRSDGTMDKSKQAGEEEVLMTVSETFEYIMQDGWTGIQGKNAVPSWAEWQRALSGARGGGTFISYGLGPCLAHFPPERLAGMSVNSRTGGGVRMALLVGRSATEGSLRRLAKLANKKTVESMKLESSVETSILMTLAGVDCVVINGWASSLSANRRLMLRLMKKLSSGMSIAESIGTSMEREYENVGGTSSSSGSSSRPKSGGKSGGKKKMKEVVAQDGVGLSQLKLRVRFNPFVFGLPHVVAKK